MRAAIFGLIVGLVVLVATGVLGFSIESWSEDRRLAWSDPPPRSTSPRVVLVTISDATYRELALPRIFWGAHLARAIERLSEAGARAIGIDLIQTTPVDRYAPELDETLAATLMNSPNVTLIYQRVRLPDGSGLTLKPHDQLATALLLGGGQLGHNHLWTDPDRVVRKWRIAGHLDGVQETSLPLSLVAQATGRKSDLREDGALYLDDTQLTSAQNGRLQIRFRGPPGSYPSIPFERLVADESTLSTEELALLDGSIVLVGSISLADQDVHLAPSSDQRIRAWMPGLELHAHVVDTILADDGFRRPPGALVFTLVLAVLAMSCAAFAFLTLLSGATLCLALVLAFSTLVIQATESGLLLPWAAPVLSLTAAFGATWLWKAWVTSRQKREIRHLFERYVSKSVVATLIENPELARLAGKRQEVTVLFSDIRNFTSLSETMDAQEVSRLLNRYLTRMTRILIKHEATIDKYIGDGIMAIFGAPLDLEDAPELALRCGLEMIEALADLRAQWLEEGLSGVESFDIGIGIHSGIAFVGNVGSPERMEYTAIGDTVNLASRLESANKELGTRLLISEATWEKVRTLAEVGRSQEISVKGRQQKVIAYEVVGTNAEPREERS